MKILILEDKLIEVKEIFDGGTLHGVDKEVGGDVSENNQRHSPNSGVESLNFSCPSKYDDDGNNKRAGRSQKT